MKKRSNKWFKVLQNAVLLLLITLSFSNCVEKVEGCLDIEAENFSFSADIVCPDDCCVYPTMTFEIAFRWDTVALVYGQPYNLTLNDQVIKVTKTKFYISDISLTNDSESFSVTNRIDLTVNDGMQSTETFVDDFTLLSRDFTSFDYEIGEIRGAGTFDTIKFVVGLTETANKVEPASAPDGHPLAIQSDTMWSAENDYVFNKLIMVPDTNSVTPTDPREFNVTYDQIEIVLPFKTTIEVGTNVTIPIKIDYYKWLEGIAFETSDSVAIVQQIVDQTAEAFSINE